MQQSFLPLTKITNESYSKIFGYPRCTVKQFKSRINELAKLKITSISFYGKTKIREFLVLGKGYTGIVVLAKRKNKLVAVKIRRTDSPRNEMKEEVRLLKLANKAGVGPSFIDSSKNFLIMEYLDGEEIGSWIKETKKIKITTIKRVIKKVLEDCYNLDKIGLDHGELSSITEHVIVGNLKTTLIDFESASTKRRVSNVTSATQAICIGSGISKSVKKIHRIPSKNKIIKNLRDYKNERSLMNFKKILKTLEL